MKEEDLTISQLIKMQKEQQKKDKKIQQESIEKKVTPSKEKELNIGEFMKQIKKPIKFNVFKNKNKKVQHDTINNEIIKKDNIKKETSVFKPIINKLPSIGYLDNEKFVLKYTYNKVKILENNSSSLKYNDIVDFKLRNYNKIMIIRNDNVNEIDFMYENYFTQMIIDFLKRNEPVTGIVCEIENEVYADLYFYKKWIDPTKDMELITVKTKLTGNKNLQMQDVIECCYVNEEISITFDYDKEKYVASTYDDIGYIPPKYNNVIENMENLSIDVEGKIIDLIYLDNDKIDVIIELKLYE